MGGPCGYTSINDATPLKNNTQQAQKLSLAELKSNFKMKNIVNMDLCEKMTITSLSTQNIFDTNIPYSSRVIISIF